MTEQYDDFQYFGDHTVIGYIILEMVLSESNVALKRQYLVYLQLPRKRNNFLESISCNFLFKVLQTRYD